MSDYWGTWGIRSRGAALALLLFLGACGGADPVGPDPAVEPFVGDWEATEFTITNSGDPDAEPMDILEGGTFTINVQPSGQYTAILEIQELPEPVVELGQMSVGDGTVTLNPADGAPATSTFHFDGPDRVTLDGPTEFDFNRDGEPDPAEAHIVLVQS